MITKNIIIDGKEISVFSKAENDYISLTDMARSQLHDVVIIKWLSLKNTIEYLGEWEALYNPNFNYTEYGTIKNSAGSNNFVLFVKQWRESNPDEKGNIRDTATIEQLVVLSNMESINALLIENNIPQKERLIQLNKVAISQMRSLLVYDKVKEIEN
jgi:hypothetical protein